MKVGKKNTIRLDPLAFNLALLGESGIGKTTIIKQYCEKLAGEDGYIFLNMGKEDGCDAIDGINFVNCPTWHGDYDEEENSIGFSDFVEDVVENKNSDYADLKVVVIDTYDELFAIAEPEVIRLHNKQHPEKKVNSIKAAFGGFQGGEDKAVEIVLDALWSLKKVGVSFIVIGHTKTRNITDPVTGDDYLQLTTNMSAKYFNALKTKVHLLGVAAFDRQIMKQNTGKKNPVTGQKIEKGVIKSEARMITFRDDNFVIDSKSRFSDIVDKIPFDVDELISAINTAIKSEAEKSGSKMKDIEKHEKDVIKKKNERIKANELQQKANKERDGLILQLNEFFNEHKTDKDIIKPVLSAIRELGYSKPGDIQTLDEAKQIFALIA